MVNEWHKVRLAALMLVAILGSTERLSGQSPSTSLAAWRLIWADEFDQANGSRPNPSRWAFDIGGSGWGNQELESYTSRTNNARIENGMLVIEARQEDYTGPDGMASSYTSARLKSQGKFSTTYGRIEARIQLPRGQGLWPAFWLVGTDIGTVGWPMCGEVDIMENIGREPQIVRGTLHGPGYSGSHGIGKNYISPTGRPFADGFHLYAVEWSRDSVRFLVDNQAYFVVTPANLPAGTTWVFNGPQFIILNVAVGGSWPGSPDNSTLFPQRMLVDYVRVYAATEAPTPSIQVLQKTNHVFVEWPSLFPQARLETSRRPIGPWVLQATAGERTAGGFFTEIQPGFYRLQVTN